MKIIDKKLYREIEAESGKFLTKDGVTFFTKGIMFTEETEADYTEVDKMPKIDRNYNQRVNDLIRQKYSASEELSILRQRDTKPEEFTAYYDYAEECKLNAKTLI